MHDKGLYAKYNVSRTDGKDQPGGDHEGCQYFVLDLTHDRHAIPAIQAYIDSCVQTHPNLAVDLVEAIKKNKHWEEYA